MASRDICSPPLPRVLTRCPNRAERARETAARSDSALLRKSPPDFHHINCMGATGRTAFIAACRCPARRYRPRTHASTRRTHARIACTSLLRRQPSETGSLPSHHRRGSTTDLWRILETRLRRSFPVPVRRQRRSLLSPELAPVVHAVRGCCGRVRTIAALTRLKLTSGGWRGGRTRWVHSCRHDPLMSPTASARRQGPLQCNSVARVSAGAHTMLSALSTV